MKPTKMTDGLQSLLILSTGRTGTKYLAKTLQAIFPDAAVYHEAGERARLINILSHAQLEGFFPADLPLRAWQRTVLPALNAAQADGSMYIDANNHVYLFAVEHAELYPNLGVIHIIRDPRDYIRSHSSWARSRFKSFIANYLTPFWQPNGFLLRETGLGEWLRMSKLEKFAWIWKYKNRTIGQLEGTGIPYLRVRFEDLFLGKDSSAAFSEMLSFFGLAVPADLSQFLDKPINVSKPRVQSWADWPAALCQRIDAICGTEMRAEGYGTEPDWLTKIGAEAVVK